MNENSTNFRKNESPEAPAAKKPSRQAAQKAGSRNPRGRGVPAENPDERPRVLHPRCPDPYQAFGPLGAFLVHKIARQVRKNLEDMNRGIDVTFWEETTEEILRKGTPGIQVIPAQAGSGKSTWIMAFLLALCQLYRRCPAEAAELGGVLLVVQKVETLNEIHQALAGELGPGAGELMVPLQSLTPSGKALGLCPNPQVEVHTQCSPETCPYAPDCPLRALGERSRRAYILGVTQARFYGLRQNGLLDELLLREAADAPPVPRRWLIFDEKPELFEVDSLSTEKLNRISSQFEHLAARKRLTDRRACSLQGALGAYVARPLQELRRSTVLKLPDQPPRDELAGLCALSPEKEMREGYAKFREEMERRGDLRSRELQSCFRVMDRLYRGEECLFCKACGFHVTVAGDGMAPLRERQVLIFDATAQADGDYRRQTGLEILPAPPPRGTERVTFHLYTHPKLNLSKSAMAKRGMAEGLCGVVEEILEQYPAETFLCAYQKYSRFFPQRLAARAGRQLALMPGREPPCIPYFGGTNGSNDFARCENVILLGYPRLDPETYLERTFAAWGGQGFREELERTAEGMRGRSRPWRDGLRCLPSLGEYEACHLAARMEQEIYRCALRSGQETGPVHVFLFRPPERAWELLRARFPGCRVEEIREAPRRLLLCLEGGRTYQGKKTAFALVQEFLADWDGTPVPVTELRGRLGISASAWKEVRAQARFEHMLQDYGAQVTGRGRHAKLRAEGAARAQIPA